MAVYLHPDSLPHRLLTKLSHFFVFKSLDPILDRLRNTPPSCDPDHLRWALSHLRRRGLLEIAFDGSCRVARATSRGRKLVALARLPRHPLPADVRRDILVTYDIPRVRNSDRDLFRRRLQRLGFIGLHHSAWIGPASVLPQVLDYALEHRLTALVHWSPWRRTRPRAR